MLRTRLAIAASLVLLAAPATAKECRTGGAPALGGRAPAPDCRLDKEGPPPAGRDGVRAGNSPGFVDLGNGTQVRIGGRVRADAVTGR